MTEVMRLHERSADAHDFLKEDQEAFRVASEQFDAIHPIPYLSLPPVGAEIYTNFDPDPLEIAHLDVLALIERGYPIYCTEMAFTPSRDSVMIRRAEEDREAIFQPPAEPELVEGHVAAYVSPIHISALEELGELIAEHPKSILASTASMSMVNINDTMEDMAAEHPLEANWWQRAYLTSCLRHAYEHATPELRPDDATVYQQLRQEGIQPFLPEDLYALIHAALQSVLEENPELAPENFQPL